MIQKLRIKIVAMAMFLVTLVLILGSVFTYLAAMGACDQIVWDILRDLVEEQTETNAELVLPLSGRKMGELTLNGSVVCTVELDAAGQVTAVRQLMGEAAMSQDTLEEVLSRADESGGGRWENGWYYRQDHTDGARLAIASNRNDLRHDLATRLIRALHLVAIPGLMVLLVFCWIASGFALRPAKKAIRYQRQFLEDAGHELKTPLSAISVNAAALEAERGSSKYLDCIQNETQRMGALIHNMMEAACMEEAFDHTKKQKTDLTALVYQAALPFECVALERQIRYELEIQEDVFCTCVPEKFRQLAAILLDNAFKYVDEGGSITVSLKTDGRRVVFEVGNSGPGIRKEDLPHVFERFYRCDKARRGNGSYGLGLAIAQTIAREHHGRLTVQSKEHVWTTFQFVI